MLGSIAKSFEVDLQLTDKPTSVTFSVSPGSSAFIAPTRRIKDVFLI